MQQQEYNWDQDHSNDMSMQTQQGLCWEIIGIGISIEKEEKLIPEQNTWKLVFEDEI